MAKYVVRSSVRWSDPDGNVYVLAEGDELPAEMPEEDCLAVVEAGSAEVVEEEAKPKAAKPAPKPAKPAAKPALAEEKSSTDLSVDEEKPSGFASKK